MKILDFTKQPLTAINFVNETIFAMCYVPKVIVFETSEEIWKFKAVCEVYLAEPLENSDDQEIIDGYCVSDICRWFVDKFEEEAFMLRHEYAARIIVLTSDIPLECLDDSVNVATNRIQCEMNMPMKYLEVFNREITKLLNSDMTGKLKVDTQEMFRSISTVFTEDINLWKSGNAKYFKRDVKDSRDSRDVRRKL